MNKLLVICFVGVVLCTSLLIKDIGEKIKTRRMVKRTINNCFKILEEKETRQ